MIKLNILLLLIVLSTPLFCHVDRNSGKSLGVKNNTDQRIYFWQSGIWDKHHYQDTVPPSELPGYINSVPSGGIAGASEYDPDLTDIFSSLPEGLMSTYFFEKLARDQDDWDRILLEKNYSRIDMTREELERNDFLIIFPQE